MKSTKAISSSKQKTNKVLAVLTLCTLAITMIIIGQFLVLDQSINKTLQNGTVINGYNLSGMSKDEATLMLSTKFEDKADEFELNITNPESGQSWSFNKSDFELNSDIHTILEYSQDRDALINDKEKTVDFMSQFEKSGGSINVAFNYIFVGLDQQIESIISQVETAPINSEIQFLPNTLNIFNITDSVYGKRVDKTQLYTNINDQFLTSNKINVELSFIEEAPLITKEYNESLTQKIAHFKTMVSDSTGGRKHNVKLALSQFDGMIVAPHQSVSFNEVIGEHSTTNGYKTATIIYNGEFTDGIGGGICQASTTLYNALLLSGAQIDEVHRHTLPVSYVSPALDAMVAEYTSDLKFTNSSDYPMYIHTYSDASSVSVDIYSHEPDYTYKTRSETIETIHSDGDKIITDTDGKYSNHVLFKGEYFRLKYPKDGYIAKAYLQKWTGDKMIEEKEIRHEIYQPQKGIVIEGASEVPAGLTPIDTGVEIIGE